MDREVIPTLPDTPMDAPIPFLYEWTTLLLGRCCRTLRDAGIYHGLWASIFQYNCDVSVVRAFIDAWNIETNTLVTCQGEFSVTLLDMDRIFGLPISGHFYDEYSPTVADFTDVRSSALPYSCRRLFQAYHHLCRSSESNVISATAWVEFWFRTEDNVVPVNDPWTAWYASYGKDMPPPREFSTTERDVFDFLRVTPGKEDEVHLAALLSVWLSWFVFRSTHDNIRPMVFKVASYMATGVRFALAGPALACLFKGLGQAVAGWPSIVPWPYLYSWLAVYFHTHGEDLGGAHRPGMVAFGNPSLQRNFDEDQAHNLFRRLPVLVWNRYALGWNSVSALVDEPKLKRPLPKAAYESLLSVRCCFLTARRSLRYFIEPYNPTRFARKFGYCQDLPEEFKSNRREVTSLSELMNLWRANVIRPCGRLDLPLPGEPTRDLGVTLAYYNWWKEHMSPHFEVLSEMESSTREKASRISGDRRSVVVRESLGILSSKLEDAEITLSEVAEELSEAKDDEEDARERLELAKEQLQSAGTKVVYLTAQAEQIQESVRDLKKAVVAAEQMVAEIIARPTLSATEEAALLSLRADFAEAQQEIAKDL
ncbi:hypothetical protein H6P81_002656 [Aristolochia fimbriata]|uniref:Aminotransferase-like plant mobile domain-containing protein n=1 Tax=Aristolochia fimbriata TaxID=158543 RepID=A0AAV7FEX9_ARIFI|nr:hypothetical protein H6P81_002656 [Aristolochia fimbriata]